jgi:hypothetical protein
MSKKSIRNPASRGNKINSVPTSNKRPSAQEHPIFSLKYLRGDFCITNCTKDEQAAFALKLHLLSQVTWMDLQLAPRHGIGYELIPVKQVNISIPPEVTQDITSLHVFRFSGKKAMIGFKDENIYHVLGLDRNFTAYNHG